MRSQRCHYMRVGRGGIPALRAVLALAIVLFAQCRGHAGGWRQNAVYRAVVREKLAALTFDDGPHPEFTPAVLDVLDKHNVRATFFMVGSFVELYPEIAKEVADRGHAIGNHTYSHPARLELLPDWAILREAKRCAEAIHRATGQRPVLFRPPRGRLGSRAVEVLSGTRYKVVLWTVSADHHEARTPQEMAARVLKRICPGAIILLHDGSAPARWRDVVATSILIEALHARGYRLVTVPELLQSEQKEISNRRDAVQTRTEEPSGSLSRGRRVRGSGPAFHPTNRTRVPKRLSGWDAR